MNVITILALVASLHTPAGHHYGWNRPHNPHHHRPPAATCEWVIGGAIGDVPRCVSP